MGKLNIFGNADIESYVGRKNPLDHYYHQCAIYLSRLEDIPYEDALAFVKKETSETGAFPPKSPEMIFAHSPEPGTKELAETTLWEYAYDCIDKKYIMTPSLTSYYPPEIMESLCTPFIFKKSAERDVLKKVKLNAKRIGDYDTMASSDAGQNKVKYYLNGQSGGYTVKVTSFYNQTGHPALTSTCRTGVSYANANNERFIEGNRHYYSVDCTIQNILVAMAEYPTEEIGRIVEKYNLHIPTIQETIDCVMRSAKRNWRASNGIDQITALVQVMTDNERCALVYVCDLYQLEKLNPEFIKEFIEQGIALEKGSDYNLDVASAKAIFSQVDPDVKTTACYLNQDRARGKDLGEMIDEKNIGTSKYEPDLYCDIAATAKHLWEHVTGHLDFIHALFRMPTLHVGIAKFPDVYRMNIPVSDTDSSVFTLQRWTTHYCGQEYFSDKAWRIGYFLSYAVCQQLDHLMVMFNASMSVPVKYLDNFKLKNEYYFPWTGVTGRAKHYWTNEANQEGNMFIDMKLIKKGVGLRGNNISNDIAEAHDEYCKMIIDKVMKNNHVTLQEVFEPILNLHYSIIDDVYNGGNRYLRSLEARDDDQYKKGDADPNVMNRKLWDFVYAPIYGEAPTPPYESVFISVELESKTAIDKWLDTFSDVDLGQRMRDFIEKNVPSGTIGTLRFPEQTIQEHKIPPDIRRVMNIRKITAKILAPFYITLESLGIYFMDKSITKIISDYYDDLCPLHLQVEQAKAEAVAEMEQESVW